MTTVVTTDRSGPYTAAAQTTFAVTFQSLSDTEIVVTLDGVPVSPAIFVFNRDDDGTGEVVFTTPQTGQIEILSDPDFAMQHEFERQGAFYPDQINSPIDQLARQDIFLKERLFGAEADIDALEANDAAQDALLAALSSGTTFSSLTLPAANRAALAALSTSLPAFLFEDGREGGFVFKSGNFSTQVAADTQQGIYVAPTSAPTGASGAWVRQYSGPADVRWFGAKVDNVTNDKTALQAALNVAGHVQIPLGKTLLLTAGDVQLPSGAFLHLAGNIRYTGATQYIFRVLGNKSKITVFGHGTISCALDLEFLQVFRLDNAVGEVIDGFRLSGGVRMEYTDTVHTGGDRWMVVCNGQGTRQNVIVENVILTGRMQLFASGASNGILKNCEIRNNRIHNAGANPISISCTGGIAAGSTGRAENVRIVGNTITADNTGHSSVGIFIGVDGSTNDQMGQLQDIYIGDNHVNITASPDAVTDLLVRLGNDASNLANGYLSIADKIVVNNNRFYFGINIDQPAITSANALTRATNFALTNNKFYGGDIILSHLADGATVQGNQSIRISGGGGVRMGPNNGRLNFVANKWATFLPQSGDAEFEIWASGDTYEGALSAASDQPVKLNVNAGKVQTLYLENCTINSQSTGGTRGPVKTSGAGTANVYIRNLASHTTWALNAPYYEHTATSGGITDYTQRPVTYTPTLTAVNNATGLTLTKAVYERRENYIRVSAVIAGTATAGATSTRVGLTLPVASAFTTAQDCIGQCQTVNNTNNDGGSVSADTTNDIALASFMATASGAFTLNLQFQYQIK